MVLIINPVKGSGPATTRAAVVNATISSASLNTTSIACCLSMASARACRHRVSTSLMPCSSGAFFMIFRNAGMLMAINSPITATTTMISTNVNARFIARYWK